MSGLIAGAIGVFVGAKLGIVEAKKFWPVIAVAVAGYVVLMIGKAAWVAIFVSAHVYEEEKAEANYLEKQFKEEQTLRLKADAQFLRRAGQIDVLENRLRVAEGELEPKKRELADTYAAIETLRPLQDEVNNLKKSLEDKERDLAALIPPEQQSNLRLQARGLTHIVYDHESKMYTHDFSGNKYGLSIVIQIANLAVRGAPAKSVRVRAQANYLTQDERLLLTPLVWIDSKTSDAVIGAGEIKELVIARRDVHGFWDFLTHGPHGSTSPTDGIDFDMEIDLIDVDKEKIIDVTPSLLFRWHWREHPLTPHFYPITKPTILQESIDHNDA